MIWLSLNFDRFMQNLLRIEYEKILLLTPANSWGDYHGLSKPVEVHFIGQSGADEWLFRLVDPERPTETAVLKQAFPLTDRETEVLLWISKGKTNREIGMILSTSPRTINKHLEQVFKKLGVENRTTAATLALQQLNRQDVQND